MKNDNLWLEKALDVIDRFYERFYAFGSTCHDEILIDVIKLALCDEFHKGYNARKQEEMDIARMDDEML
jgi:hypothetical protein